MPIRESPWLEKAPKPAVRDVYRAKGLELSRAEAMGFSGKMPLRNGRRCSKIAASCGASVLNESAPCGRRSGYLKIGKGSDVALRKLLAVVLLVCLFPLASAALGADEPAFRITPEGAALLRERGSVGYLYWGMYRGC